MLILLEWYKKKVVDNTAPLIKYFKFQSHELMYSHMSSAAVHINSLNICDIHIEVLKKTCF